MRQNSAIPAAIFVSHAVEDQDDVAELVRVIGKALPSIRFFVSSGASIAFGEDWRVSIDKNLRDAAALLVVLSARAIDRPWIHFEAGVAHALEIRTFIALIDGFDAAHIPATLSSLQSASVPRELKRLIGELGSHLGVKPRRRMVAGSAAAPGPVTPFGAPGIYVRRTHFDLANGWVRYGGSADMIVTSRWVDPGASFDNAFRFPPEDTLNASCDIVVARLLPVDRVDLYIVVRLTSDRAVKLYLSTSHLSWGFTGTPSDEFRIPVKVSGHGRWHSLRVNLRTFASPLGAPIKRVIGFKLRGGSRVSHIVCCRGTENVILSARDIDVPIAYPA